MLPCGGVHQGAGPALEGLLKDSPGSAQPSDLNLRGSYSLPVVTRTTEINFSPLPYSFSIAHLTGPGFVLFVCF